MIASLKHFLQDVFEPLAIAVIAAILILEPDALAGHSDTEDMKMNATMLAWMLGPWEIALILIATLLLFGGKKLPELAKGLGKGLRVFKKEMKGVRESIEEAVDAEPDYEGDIQDEGESQDSDDSQDKDAKKEDAKKEDDQVEQMH